MSAPVEQTVDVVEELDALMSRASVTEQATLPVTMDHDAVIQDLLKRNESYAQHDPVSGRVRIMNGPNDPAPQNEQDSRTCAMLIAPDAQYWLVCDPFAPHGVRSNWDKWERYLAKVARKSTDRSDSKKIAVFDPPYFEIRALKKHQQTATKNRLSNMAPLGITPRYASAIARTKKSNSWYLLTMHAWPLMDLPKEDEASQLAWHVHEPRITFEEGPPRLVFCQDQWLAVVNNQGTQLRVYRYDRADDSVKYDRFILSTEAQAPEGSVITAISCSYNYVTYALSNSELVVLLREPHPVDSELSAFNRQVYQLKSTETNEPLLVDALRHHPFTDRLLYIQCTNGQLIKAKLRAGREKRAQALAQFGVQSVLNEERRLFYKFSPVCQIKPTAEDDYDEFNRTGTLYKHPALEQTQSLQVLPVFSGREKNARFGKEAVMVASNHMVAMNWCYTFENKPLKLFEDKLSTEEYGSFSIPNQMEQLCKRDLPDPVQCASVAGELLVLHIVRGDTVVMINSKSGRVVSTFSLSKQAPNAKPKELPYQYQSLLVTPSRTVVLTTECKIAVVASGVQLEDILEPMTPAAEAIAVTEQELAKEQPEEPMMST